MFARLETWFNAFFLGYAARVSGDLAVGLVPVALLLVAVNFSGDVRLVAVIYRVWTVALLVVIGDLLATAYALRRLIKVDFPAERRIRGHLFYGLIRSTVFRRFRMPPPRVRPAPLLRR